MKLISAFGSQEMAGALDNHNVHKIVDIMLLHIIKDQNFFKIVALFLREHPANTAPNFAVKLDALRHYGQFRPDTAGHFTALSYVADLVAALETLYSQPQNALNFQRGAIVELLAFKLIGSRCQTGECFGNYRFVYEINSRSTDQIDVAVFSRTKRRIEAYTCKINAKSIASVDCTNLIELTNEAQAQNYDIHIGAICFENSRKIEQRLRDFSAASIKAYGIDNIKELQTSPF